MINFKMLGYGAVASLVLGLSGCYMDGQRSQQMDQAPRGKMEAHSTTAASAGTQGKAMHKTSASAARQPIQQVAPGPKRAKAEKIPVIQ